MRTPRQDEPSLREALDYLDNTIKRFPTVISITIPMKHIRVLAALRVLPAEPQPPIDAGRTPVEQIAVDVFEMFNAETHDVRNRALERVLAGLRALPAEPQPPLLWPDTKTWPDGEIDFPTEPQPPIDADIRDIWRTLSGADIRAMLAMWQARQGAATEPADGRSEPVGPAPGEDA